MVLWRRVSASLGHGYPSLPCWFSWSLAAKSGEEMKVYIALVLSWSVISTWKVETIFFVASVSDWGRKIRVYGRPHNSCPLLSCYWDYYLVFYDRTFSSATLFGPPLAHSSRHMTCRNQFVSTVIILYNDVIDKEASQSFCKTVFKMRKSQVIIIICR